jgi:hypothetical protein
MATSPEIVSGEPQIQERREEFIVDETLKQAGAQVVQKTFKAQVKDDKGSPIIQTPPAQVITVSPPSDQVVLTQQSKGNISSSLTWLATFWLRIVKKATHFGWKVVGRQNG